MCEQMGLLPWQPKHIGSNTLLANVLVIFQILSFYSAEINRLRGMPVNANVCKQFNSDLLEGKIQ